MPGLYELLHPREVGVDHLVDHTLPQALPHNPGQLALLPGLDVDELLHPGDVGVHHLVDQDNPKENTSTLKRKNLTPHPPLPHKEKEN